MGRYSTTKAIDRCVLTVHAGEQYQVPTVKLELSAIGTISLVIKLHGWQKALWKADQL